MSKSSGVFVTLEGGDGAGKSTLLNLITKEFNSRKIPHFCTREPGGTSVSEQIRALILNPDSHMESLTELFLYEASRHEHVVKVIKPKLNEGVHVLCDRFTTSSLAYQGYGRGLGAKLVGDLNNIATTGLNPNIIIWLKIEPSIAKKRAEQRGQKDRLEKEFDQFHENVYKGFQELSQIYKNNFIVLDATHSPDVIFKSLLEHPIWKRYFS